MRITVDGLDQAQANFKKAPDQYKWSVIKALMFVLLDLKGKSQRLAPIDKGDLRGSAYTSMDQSQLVGEAGFTAPYATRQHEEVGYRHPKGGRAKYLETPLKDNLQQYIKKISDAIKGVW